MDKEQRRQAQAVIDKYTRGERVRLKAYAHVLPAMAAGVSIYAGALTSGVVAVCGGLMTAACELWALSFPVTREWDVPMTVENRAGQTINCRLPWARRTLEVMEERLRESFARAMKPFAPGKEKKAFFDLAREVSDDLEKLRPAFRIASAGPVGRRDRIELLVAEQPVPDSWPPAVRYILLDDARAQVRRKALKAA